MTPFAFGLGSPGLAKDETIAVASRLRSRRTRAAAGLAEGSLVRRRSFDLSIARVARARGIQPAAKIE